ncbi:hypothetical protein EMIHUDRAFT_469470 [Emiliania huxleyi CCMP1516]|uniref:PCI domain-containing protein n=2 Tax=Emiliania huxleyi TaxID=2903 RepID=A0A0D3JJG0_EMIH1|nr:hypothetical protein EMIHUDRAFT_469470 [Emiliania huxleyi CCMP1516]EOD23645.1 hypothetical protein EMIHUDRAFT_469470 [Emiliania huxleyi CCMP1516]|eukprot:XP_005776074.1 hypothetical protein EMIHUDRAFT_469470 [Emiliania huxleyi CCMP1516]
MSGVPSTAQQAAQTISQAVSRQDGAGLAAALRLDLGNTALIAQLNSSPPLEQICGRALVEPWDELLLEQLHYIKAAAAGEHEAAYSHCERAAACFQAAFEKESDWPVPALHSLCLNLRRAAAAADAALVAKGERAVRQQEAARTMQKFFQVCVTDRAPLPVSKKWGSVAVEKLAAGHGGGAVRAEAGARVGALVVINALFHVYFAINNLRLCQNLIRAALDGQTVEGRHFAKAEVVTYKYFTGRLALLNSDFGDLNAFEEQLATHQQRFIRHGSYLQEEVSRKCLGGVSEVSRHGSYLLVERSKLIVYRNFFRRVALLHPDKSTKLDIKRFQACLKATNTEMEVDEIECILANLIYCGYIKGYISHAHGKLVVSKGAPFPPLRELGLTSAV